MMVALLISIYVISALFVGIILNKDGGWKDDQGFAFLATFCPILNTVLVCAVMWDNIKNNMNKE